MCSTKFLKHDGHLCRKFAANLILLLSTSIYWNGKGKEEIKINQIQECEYISAN